MARITLGNFLQSARGLIAKLDLVTQKKNAAKPIVRRARTYNRTEPYLLEKPSRCDCECWTLADEIWQTMTPEQKALWHAAVKAPNMSGYDLWMKEALTLCNQAQFLPDYPSPSGGFDGSKAIPGITWPPPDICLVEHPGALWENPPSTSDCEYYIDATPQYLTFLCQGVIHPQLPDPLMFICENNIPAPDLDGPCLHFARNSFGTVLITPGIGAYAEKALCSYSPPNQFQAGYTFILAPDHLAQIQRLGTYCQDLSFTKVPPNVRITVRPGRPAP